MEKRMTVEEKQVAARKAYGDALVDEWVASPTANMRCFRCGEHHGLVCMCTPEEKRAYRERRRS